MIISSGKTTAPPDETLCFPTLFILLAKKWHFAGGVGDSKAGEGIVCSHGYRMVFRIVGFFASPCR